MEQKECPYCQQKVRFDAVKCDCGYWFSANNEDNTIPTPKFSQKKPEDETFFQRNRFGINVFIGLLVIRFVWGLMKEDNILVILISTLIDSIFILLIAAVSQVLYDRFFKK